MKTIEEAAKEFKKRRVKANLDCEVDLSEHIPVIEYESERGFEAGVEFAQRWIPVEEELPNPNSWIIVKKHNGLKLGMYFNTDNQFLYGLDNQTNQITHWRPIEIK